MDKLPFSIYDFFGYLASGFVVLVAVVAAFVGATPLNEKPALLVGLLLVVAAYIAGHLVANIAGDLLERRLVGKRLGMPTAILLGERTPSHWAARLLPGYSSPLPNTVRDRVLQRAERAGVSDRDQGLFFYCHAVMKRDAAVQARLDTFLNLYGFCRNMAMALSLSATALAIGLVIGTADTGPDVPPGWWLAASLVAGVGLFYRYLKFFRQYGVELLTSYAESDAGDEHRK